MANRKWSELSASQRALLLTLVSVELSLTATAAVDLIRRPADQVHGRKGLWALGLFIQPVGPVAYLCAHRR
ncbi:MAG TPA: PLDc N-terminal domain-containing protein [Actinomycetota bacterium]|nr:PLDc N-terminal domain-containing protein [Actinomycetota bacterium]